MPGELDRLKQLIENGGKEIKRQPIKGSNSE